MNTSASQRETGVSASMIWPSFAKHEMLRLPHSGPYAENASCGLYIDALTLPHKRMAQCTSRFEDLWRAGAVTRYVMFECGQHFVIVEPEQHRHTGDRAITLRLLSNNLQMRCHDAS
jgi:hypothetical protein